MSRDRKSTQPLRGRMSRVATIYRGSVILLQLLVWIGGPATVSDAGATADVFLLHSPVQPATTVPVTYSATASDEVNGIATIEIWEDRRILTLCSGQKCAIPDPNAPAPTLLKTCSFGGVTTAACSFTTTGGYSNGSYIGYRAVVQPSGAAEPPAGFIYFAAGAFPWPNDPIPLYIRGDPAEKIDLVFIPDEDDYDANNTGFVSDVLVLIRDAYFSQNPSAEQIRARRDMWNFYLTYQQGNAQPSCYRTLPPNWGTMSAIVDSGFIVHIEDFRDCSGIGPGTTFSAERVLAPTAPDYQKSLAVPIHETGHSVFSLADEYKYGGLFESEFPEHNVFTDRVTCRANALDHQWPLKNCKKVRRTSWWRSDDGSDIMEDSSTTANKFGPSGEGRLGWWYEYCAGGNC